MIETILLMVVTLIKILKLIYNSCIYCISKDKRQRCAFDVQLLSSQRFSFYLSHRLDYVHAERFCLITSTCGHNRYTCDGRVQTVPYLLTYLLVYLPRLSISSLDSITRRQPSGLLTMRCERQSRLY